MKKTAIRIVVLLILQSLWLETSQAADPGGAKFNEELSKQEQIYQSRGEKVPEGYITGRSLLSYTLILSSEFDRALAILEPKDRWLDIGAGAGRAVLDYYSSRYDLMHLEGWERRSTKARAVAISIEDRRTPPVAGKRRNPRRRQNTIFVWPTPAGVFVRGTGTISGHYRRIGWFLVIARPYSVYGEGPGCFGSER